MFAKLTRTSFFAALLLSLSPLTAQVVIVNGASYAPGQPMAPGSFASAFGSNLCQQQAYGSFISPGQLPTTLGGCSLTVNGTPAMMQFVSPGQINFIVPASLGSGNAAIVVNNGSQTFHGSMGIAGAAPGVFALNSMGMGNGAMVNQMMGWKAGPFSVTTNGAATPVSMFLTGMNLSGTPTVSVGGMSAMVTYFGNAPGLAGLQQINFQLTPQMAGAGRVPVVVTSAGQVSNVTNMLLLPTNSMMQGMPGWGSGMMIDEDMPRAREMSTLALNSSNHTIVVSDANDDALRILSLDTRQVVSTITLPQGSEAEAVAVNDSGTLAAVALTARAAVAVISLNSNNAVTVINTGGYPARLKFTGSTLLVTNASTGTVSVIDTTALALTHTVNVGFGPVGIDAANGTAVVANMQAGSLSLINLSDYSVSTIALPAGVRPHEVAISTQENVAVVSAPMTGALFLLNLTTKNLTSISIPSATPMGSGSLAAYQNFVFIGNQMASSVSMLDLGSGAITATFPVDPGPRSLAVDPTGGQLVVLCEGTGVVDLMSLADHHLVTRFNAGASNRSGTWNYPVISSVTPAQAAPGSAAFTITINGSNLQSVTSLQFLVPGALTGTGGGMMGGGMGGNGFGGGMMGGGFTSRIDPNINVSNFQVNSAGTVITATVQVLSAAATGTRQIYLSTGQGFVMMMFGGGAVFTVN